WFGAPASAQPTVPSACPSACTSLIGVTMSSRRGPQSRTDTAPATSRVRRRLCFHAGCAHGGRGAGLLCVRHGLLAGRDAPDATGARLLRGPPAGLGAGDGGGTAQ